MLKPSPPLLPSGPPSGDTERRGTMDRILEGLTSGSEATSHANIPLYKRWGYRIDKIPTADERPLEYPRIFQTADALIVNRTGVGGWGE